MSNTMQYKGYTASIEYSAEDECFVGQVIGTRHAIIFDGTSVEEIRANFMDMIDDYPAMCADLGQKPNEPAAEIMKEAIHSEYRGYMPLIRYSAEDGCFVGEVAGLYRHGISFEGETEEEIRKDFEAAIDFYLETEQKPEKPFAGLLTIRIPPEIHVELCRKAQSSGNSLDDWLAKELKESVLHV